MPKTYTPIATQTLSTSAASVTFSSIPGSYTDLVLVINPTMASNADVTLIFNGDTANNYSSTYLSGNGTTASSSRFSTMPKIYLDSINTGTGIVQYNVSIMNYANTTTYKTALARFASAGVGTQATVGLWRSTAAITSMTITGDSINFTPGSTFTLYGILKA
jgi:hypothetical protein